MARVAVIGGGISGIAAARAVVAAGHDAVLFEGSPRLGGALRTGEFAGLPVDEGADAFLVRVPAGRELATASGAVLVHPAARQASLLIHGRLRALPRSVLGVPVAPLAAHAALGAAGAGRAAADTWLPATPYGDDISVGAHLRRRLGSAVVERLVEPLLGGVYAGRADELSLATVLPQLHDPAGGSLVRAARRAAGPVTDAPVFASLETGLGTLPALAARGLDVRLGSVVTGLVATVTGWLVEVGSRAEAPVRSEAADAVVLAIPAPRARRLLAGVDPVAAELAGSTDYASVAIVTLAWPRSASGLLRRSAGSGWLVPPGAGAVAKAVTVSTAKWQHLRDGAPDLVVARASVGRYGEERDLQRDDRELVGVVAAEVARTAQVRHRPVESRVTRWGGALPQYTPGHLARTAMLRDRLPATLGVCGAGFDGVGIPACIASGQRAAAAVLAGLAARVAPYPA